MNIASTIKTAKSVVTANSPVLLVGTAIAGVFATGVLAAKGGYKARGIVDAEQARRDAESIKISATPAPPLTTQEKVQLTWLCYAAPALTGITTIASVVGVHTIHTKRHAALAGLYAVASTKLDAYSEKAEELLGPKKTQDVNNAAAQSVVDEAGEQPFEDNEVIMIGDGTQLIYDEWGGRWVRGSIADVESAINETLRQILTEGDASLNEFYDRLGLPPTEAGKAAGWRGSDTKLEAQFGSVMLPNNRGSAVSFSFRPNPSVVRI